MRELRMFGIVMGCALSALALTVFLRRGDVYFSSVAAAAAAAFFLAAVFTPVFLRPLRTAWMGLAFALGWLNTRLILCVLFYLLFTPLGLLARFFGKDPLDRAIQKERQSYWLKKEQKPFDPLDYQKQF